MFTFCLENASAQKTVKLEHPNVRECREIKATFPLSLPTENPKDNASNALQLRAEFQLDNSTAVQIWQLKFPSDEGFYNSDIVIHRGSVSRNYTVSDLIKGGASLGLVRASILCNQANQSLLILGFEAGWTGAVQSFVTVGHSAGDIQVSGLPSVQFGKVIVHRKSLWKAILWSAEAEDQGECDACKKPYLVRDCSLGNNGWICTKRPGQTSAIDPNVVTSDIIEVK
jgi:hypothetical protein